MRMGAVHLTVADLGRSLDWYENAIGLQAHARENGTARLGAGGDDLVVLTEEPGAEPADGYAGLFHLALLVPERRDLARFLDHAARERVPLQGLSDHYVSEAIYLRDPDHHGIEVYADRPRELWDGKVGERMTTLPLDVHDLLAQAGDGSFDGLPAGTTMGHVHLSVADVEQSLAFYRKLGVEVMAHFGGQAAFLAYGGYHHHLGLNTWESRGAPFAPAGRARLVGFEILGSGDERALVDPSGIPLSLAR
jgi:catechol 2,3-dioxygenase